MDENPAPVNSIVDTNARLVENLIRRWTDFAEKTATAASDDPSIPSILGRVKDDFNVIGTIRQTIHVHRLAKMALKEAGEHQRRMKSMADKLERLVLGNQNDLLAAQSKTTDILVKAIENASESQKADNVLLGTALRILSARMVTSEKFDSAIQQLQDQIRQPSNEHLSPTPQSQGFGEPAGVPGQLSTPTQQTGDATTPRVTAPKEASSERTVQSNPGFLVLKATFLKQRQDQQRREDEEKKRKAEQMHQQKEEEQQRRVDEFAKVYSEAHASTLAILQQIVPVRYPSQGSPVNIFRAFQSLWAEFPDAAQNLQEFMRENSFTGWFCVRGIASGNDPQVRRANKIGPARTWSYCPRCEGDCLEISLVEARLPDGKYYARLVR